MASKTPARSSLEINTQHAVGVIWMNRPAVRNAIDDVVIADLTRAFKDMDADDSIRAVVIAGHGPVFCAGADLNWVKRTAGNPKQAHVRDATALGEMLLALDHMQKPTVARVHGAAVGAGVALAAACDIVVAGTAASFSVREVRIGLVPFGVAPFVVRTIGSHQARRYALTGETIAAAEAYRLGLVHELVQDALLDGAVNEILGHLLQGGPEAIKGTKAFLRELEGKALSPTLLAKAAKDFATMQASPEAKEGLQSFMERRKPKWHPEA
ncbi:MAG: enoyl-CoA hydratase/isomerase family protein [Betaproteobacteria bacterium]|nr:enoyl-CoA hydratase/isomerase family protein [Betaproteobacteria bacterium]